MSRKYLKETNDFLSATYKQELPKTNKVDSYPIAYHLKYHMTPNFIGIKAKKVT